MTTSEADEPGRTAPVEMPQPTPPPAPTTAPPHAPDAAPEELSRPPAPEPVEERQSAVEPVTAVARPVGARDPQTLYVPLAVTVGDGFKFGCGFFLALVLAMLVGFVLLAALFALTTVFGLNLPISR